MYLLDLKSMGIVPIKTEKIMKKKTNKKESIIRYMNLENKKVCSIDIDGILNYYPDCWVDFINKETGFKFKDKNKAKEKLSVEEYIYLKDVYRKSDFKANLKIREEALEIIKYLKGNGYFILLLTTRPFENYPSLYSMTQKWVRKNNIPFDALEKKSVSILNKFHHVDFHIEDEIEDANRIAKAGYKVFLFEKQEDNKILHPNIIKIKCLKEILNYIIHNEKSNYKSIDY